MLLVLTALEQLPLTTRAVPRARAHCAASFRAGGVGAANALRAVAVNRPTARTVQSTRGGSTALVACCMLYDARRTLHGQDQAVGRREATDSAVPAAHRAPRSEPACPLNTRTLRAALLPHARTHATPNTRKACESAVGVGLALGLLLLDEPTNHLDTGSVAWLERFLQEYRGTLLMVLRVLTWGTLSTHRVLRQTATYSVHQRCGGIPGGTVTAATMWQGAHETTCNNSASWQQTATTGDSRPVLSGQCDGVDARNRGRSRQGVPWYAS